GESRRLAARTLHALSHAGSPDAPFVEVDCTIYAEDALGTELFGPEHASLTSRERSAAGLVASARGGTLFLDHLTALTPGVQARLLRFLDATAALRSARPGAGVPGLRIIAGSEHE